MIEDIIEIRVNWEQATTQVSGLHTIASLVYHLNYFVSATLQVMHDGPLDAKDKFSFDHPPIASQQDWESLLEKTWEDAEDLAVAIEEMGTLTWNVTYGGNGLLIDSVDGLSEYAFEKK